MREPVYTVERCYQAGAGWFVLLRGACRATPADDELPEGASVVIREGKAVRP